MNPIELMQMIRNGQNPQQLAMTLIERQLGNTPMGANLLQLAKANNTSGIEQIARNLTQARGMDYDKEFANFKNTLGL